MKTIETVITVTEDGRLVVDELIGLPPGIRRAVIVVDDAPLQESERPPFSLPVHDRGPWPADLSLRREDMYGDWGR